MHDSSSQSKGRFSFHWHERTHTLHGGRFIHNFPSSEKQHPGEWFLDGILRDKGKIFAKKMMQNFREDSTSESSKKSSPKIFHPSSYGVTKSVKEADTRAEVIHLNIGIEIISGWGEWSDNREIIHVCSWRWIQSVRSSRCTLPNVVCIPQKWWLFCGTSKDL